MALVVRLSLAGKKGQPIYRIIVGEKRSKRDGKNQATLGYYNPNLKPPELKLDRDEFDRWREKGATVSDGLRKILDSKNTQND